MAKKQLPPEMEKQKEKMKAADKANEVADDPGDDIETNDISDIKNMVKKAGNKKQADDIAKMAANMAKKPAKESLR